MRFDWLSGLDPRTGTVLHAAAWAGLVVWALRRPAAEIFEGVPGPGRWRDLRWWVIPLAAAQVGLYFLF
ncbi:MAG: hypothetical protein AB1726_15900 [Planctomycetota bacterium]